MELMFNKLVRDKIPEIIESNDEIPIIRILDNDEYRSELYKKLFEEVGEVVNASNKEDVLEELADVLEVLRAIANLENIDINDIIDIANQKRKKRGGFEKKIFLEKKLINDIEKDD